MLKTSLTLALNLGLGLIMLMAACSCSVVEPVRGTPEDAPLASERDDDRALSPDSPPSTAEHATPGAAAPEPAHGDAPEAPPRLDSPPAESRAELADDTAAGDAEAADESGQGAPSQDGASLRQTPAAQGDAQRAAPARPVNALSALGAAVTIGPMRFHVLKTAQPPESDGPTVVRYRIMVEKGLEAEAEVFRTMVTQELGRPDGWAQAGLEFVPVTEGEDLTVLLARPQTVDRLCRPLRTGGTLSCAMYGRANLNLGRWRHGAKTWGDDLDGYRRYLINHEVGHLLGMPHQGCPKPGAPAPVMLPQTKYLLNCLPNGAPTELETRRLRPNMKAWFRKIAARRARRARREAAVRPETGRAD